MTMSEQSAPKRAAEMKRDNDPERKQGDHPPPKVLRKRGICQLSDNRGDREVRLRPGALWFVFGDLLMNRFVKRKDPTDCVIDEEDSGTPDEPDK
ncbi:hypothetical protein [Thioalbus denitrificans]|uniref:Uncharacterized protein n=1 Tax=Thioalbus denitrificans TaxID=547122 RepID=A0A369CDS2_9GAMM|nr:hypothetical protein [Thioalbus denitrificans]RCX31711.1 hypothetical protein DFQ59_10258 [Thioalbus denitrificans]